MRNIFQEIQAQQFERERHRENAGGPATLSITYETLGSGELVPDEPIEFQTPFLTEPAVVAGFVLARMPDREVYELPRVSAGVMRWQQNARGFWIGAWMYYTVDMAYRNDPGPTETEWPPAPVPRIYHHFQFSGLSYKAMGDEIRDGLRTSALPTLRPGG